MTIPVSNLPEAGTEVRLGGDIAFSFPTKTHYTAKTHEYGRNNISIQRLVQTFILDITQKR